MEDFNIFPTIKLLFPIANLSCIIFLNYPSIHVYKILHLKGILYGIEPGRSGSSLRTKEGVDQINDQLASKLGCSPSISIITNKWTKEICIIKLTIEVKLAKITCKQNEKGRQKLELLPCSHLDSNKQIELSVNA